MGTLSTGWITKYVWAVLSALLVDIGDAYFWGGTTTTTPGTTNATIAAKPPPEDTLDPIQYELGAIIGVVFGVVFGIVLIGVAGFLYIRQKRQRDQEYTRRTKVKMMSSRNAGVYVDTTTQETLMQDDNYTFSSSEYKNLQTFKTNYSDDSDEELWSSKMRG